MESLALIESALGVFSFSTETLFSAVLSAIGLAVAWEYSSIKTHVVNKLFGQTLPDNASASDYLRTFKSYGKWATCKYCYPPYLSLTLFAVYSLLPDAATAALTAFFVTPLAAHWLVSPGKTASPDDDAGTVAATEVPSPAKTVGPVSSTVTTGDEVPPEPPRSSDDRNNDASGVAHTFDVDAPSHILRKLDAIVHDMKGHKEFVDNNMHLFYALIEPDKYCWSDRCSELVESYEKEKTRFREERARNPEGCPECAEGRVTNAYLYLLKELEDEEQPETLKGDESHGQKNADQG